jgi:hypothetical protein
MKCQFCGEDYLGKENLRTHMDNRHFYAVYDLLLDQCDCDDFKQLVKWNCRSCGSPHGFNRCPYCGKQLTKEKNSNG